MYERIYNDLLEKIRTGEYQTGERLPSEKELAESYGVSRITTKRAMDMLAQRQYISRSPGRGSFVSERGGCAGACEGEADGENKISEEHAGRGNLIAVIFDSFSSDFGSVLLRSIERECRRNHYGMLFYCSYGSIDEENRAIGSALELGAKGIILMCVQGERYNNTVLRLGLSGYPLVFVDRQLKGVSIPCVKTDNYSAAYELTEMLLRKGHKKICFVSHLNTSTTTINERYEGFVECIMQQEDAKGVLAKLENYNSVLLDSDIEYEEESGRAMERVLDQYEDCTAFLMVEYKMAVLMSRILMRRGKEREIATFDGLESIYCREDGFIHVRQDEAGIGKKVVELVCGWIDGERTGDSINVPYIIEK